ncbi:HD domain-containing phosphohydrolase [Pokkaliibacter sp. CJK22405]|uniref:HD domain-containing phosphohydrolase n=1 Tax=Pokkaliibacter sp. CJK22405 TaxID=3384615 RepID=UPI0039850DD8
MKSRVPHVLFLDDEVSLLEALRRNLRQSGWEMHFESSPTQAVNLLEQQNIDLIVSDMRMPEMNGVEFLEQAATLRPDSVRIILTGYADMDSTIDAVNRGKIHGFLQKPVEIQALRQMLESGIKVSQAKHRQAQILYTLAKANKALKSELEQALSFVDESNEALKDTYTSTIEAFARLLEGVKSQLQDRPFRAGIYCRLLAKHLQLETELARQVYYATLLHDIGRLGMPRNITHLRYRSLNPHDKALLEQYPILSSAALMEVEELSVASDFILAHREHIDGSGYPYRLAGGAISEGALIVGLVTYFDELLGEDESERAIKLTLEKLESVKNVFYPYELIDALGQVLKEYYHLGQQQFIALLEVQELQPGMRIGKNLYARNGIRLLTKGTELTERLIAKVQGYQERVQPDLRVAVVQHSGVKVT